MHTIICSVGGSSKGAPGPAAIGVSITDAAGNMLEELAQTIGNGTRIFAEYYAVMVGLQTLVNLLGAKTATTVIELRLTDLVVIKQLSAEEPINEPGLVPLFIEIHNLRVVNFPQLKIVQIASDKNQVIEALILEALDGPA